MMSSSQEWMKRLDWKKGAGLLPAVIQHFDSLQVLMVGYMNKEALEKTVASGLVTFFSRTKQRLWTKGETSGHILRVGKLIPDCDNDALLILAKPDGPICHLSTPSCFGAEGPTGVGFLSLLEKVILQRRANPSSASYTSKLFDSGLDRIAQKVGEEAVELVIASKNDRQSPFIGEAADLVFHFLVLLAQREVGLADVIAELRDRHP